MDRTSLGINYTIFYLLSQLILSRFPGEEMLVSKSVGLENDASTVGTTVVSGGNQPYKY